MSSIAQKSTAAAVLEKVEDFDKRLDGLETDSATQRRELATLKEKAAVPQYPPGVTPGVVGGIIGGIPKDSDGYSFLRAAGLMAGLIDAEKCKYEIDVANKLKALYEPTPFRPTVHYNRPGMLIPNSTKILEEQFNKEPSSATERLIGELKEKMVSGRGQIDPDEGKWLLRKQGYKEKDLGTLSDIAGGVLVGFPTLMELVDIQRNVEIFSQAGAMEVGLPANGRMQYPKLTGVTTAAWIGEGAAITESTPATGSLDLVAKKLGIFVDLNNELIRFGSITAEAMVRGDMAKVAALKADLGMLEGTGGTQIKGLITYTPTATTWSTGTDPLLTFAVTSSTIQISDAADMEAIMPDTAGTPTAWVMRRQLWAKIRNRRASSVSSADAAGQYLVNLTREFGDSKPLQWDGTKVVRSTQVSATRGNGSQTYVILGYFPDWITARFGVLEFLSSTVGDTQMTNDQTRLRCIQHIDAGPRHSSSFVFADSITIQ